jgi:putative ABC transport system permease protein
MLFFEIVRVAFGALRANKLRAFLTMLGIIIGVGAVIAVVAMGTGAQNAIKERISALGTTMLAINTRRQRMGGVAQETTVPLTFNDVRDLEDRSTLLTEIQPQQDSRYQVVFGRMNANVDVIGTTPNYLVVRKYEILAGRMFTAAEDRLKQRVAVLGYSMLAQLGVDNPDGILGQPIRIRGMQFIVVGVMAPKGTSTGFGDPDEQVLVPFTTGRYRIFARDRLNDINVLARSEEDIPAAMLEITHILRRSHRLRSDRPDDFQIRDQTDFLETLGDTVKTFSLLLVGVAAVSLLVGGIGIMNIMLVSVTERTREIGIRKALGATRRSVLLQFLSEAIVLCLVGGVLGIALGIGGAAALRHYMSWNTAIDPQSLAVAIGFSAGVGILFGVWPARRAATLDPIIALRYE